MVRAGGVCLCFFCNFVSKAEKVNKTRGKRITKMETHGEIFVSGGGVFVATLHGTLTTGNEIRSTPSGGALSVRKYIDADGIFAAICGPGIGDDYDALSLAILLDDLASRNG